MHIQTIRSIAKKLGISSAKISKTDLIRSIQRAEGNFDCFATADDGFCDQYDCIWRDDCLPSTKGETPVDVVAAPAARTGSKTASSKTKNAAKPKSPSTPKAAAKPKASSVKKVSKKANNG